METLWQDLKYGARQLLRNPGFTVVAVLTLALGIGANTAIFSVVHAVLLRPLPYADPARLVQIEETHHDLGRVNLTGATFLDVQERVRSFSRIAAYRSFPTPYSLSGQERPHSLQGGQVSAGYFDVMGAQPSHGRLFLEEDFAEGAPDTVILGEGVWRSVFGGDPRVIGESVRLNDTLFRIVGVLPGNFQHPAFAEIWTPLRRAGLFPENRRSHLFGVVGRLRPGVALEEARSELRLLAQQIDAESGSLDAGLGFVASTLHGRIVERVRPALWVWMGAVGLLLLVAGVNVASLAMARGLSRERELGIRTALGATRARITSQLLVENVLLALLGGTVGVLLASWSVQALVVLAPPQLPRLQSVALNGSVLFFALTVSLGAALLFGMGPALKAARPALLHVLQEGARGTAGGRRRYWRPALVTCEVAMSLVLLAGAALLGRSMIELLRVNLGFEPANLVTFGVSPSRARYPGNEAQAAYFGQILERIGALPGVEAVALTNALPALGAPATTFEPEGKPWVPGEQELIADVLAVSPAYFHLMRIPLLRGRPFGVGDVEGAQVVVVLSETAARAFFPDDDPIGKRLTMRDWNDPVVAEVVGIAADVQQRSLDQPIFPAVYFSHAQFLDRIFGLNFLVRTPLLRSSIASALAEQVWMVDKDQPLANLRTMEDVLSASVAQERFNTILLSLFAALGLLLAAVGIYGIMSFSVSERRREIGIRMALGARPTEVLRLIVGQGMLPVGAGIGIGVVAALGAGHLLSGLLFRVAPSDTAVLAGVVGLLAGVALLACYVPARRATQVDPMTALRYE